MKKNLLIGIVIGSAVLYGISSNKDTNTQEKMSDIMLANIEALAEDEGDMEPWNCYTDITITTEYVEAEGKRIKVSECETHSCVHGKGTTCTTGVRCVFYAGPMAGQESDSVTTLYC